MIVAFSVAPSGQPADANHLPGDADTASVHRAVAAAVAGGVVVIVVSVGLVMTRPPRSRVRY